MTNKTDPAMTMQEMEQYGLNPKNNQDLAEFITAFEEGNKRRPYRTQHQEAAQNVANSRKKLSELANLREKDANKLKGNDLLSIAYAEQSPTMGKPAEGTDAYSLMSKGYSET